MSGDSWFDEAEEVEEVEEVEDEGLPAADRPLHSENGNGEGVREESGHGMPCPYED